MILKRCWMYCRLDIRKAVEKADDSENLLEIILDLGRVPTARFVDREMVLRETEVTRGEIDYVDERIGEFDADNRAGMERTLHRISGIRNRRGQVVGPHLPRGPGRVWHQSTSSKTSSTAARACCCWAGRALAKPPCCAKRPASWPRRSAWSSSTPPTRSAATATCRTRRWAARGACRWREPSLQHEVMIEAVENHNPEVIVIDEIGRELEAEAARTIAERGVQLIGTAHGNSLENICC